MAACSPHKVYEYCLELEYRKSASDKYSKRNETLKCNLHEYLFLSYIQKHSSALEKVNTYFKNKGIKYELSIEHKMLVITLLQSALWTSADFDKTLQTLKKDVSDFGKNFLLFEIFSAEFYEKIKSSLQDKIAVTRVDIDDKKKYAAVFEKDEENTVRRILGKPLTDSEAHAVGSRGLRYSPVDSKGHTAADSYLKGDENDDDGDSLDVRIKSRDMERDDKDMKRVDEDMAKDGKDVNIIGNEVDRDGNDIRKDEKGMSRDGRSSTHNTHLHRDGMKRGDVGMNTGGKDGDDFENIEKVSVENPNIYEFLCQDQIIESLKSKATKDGLSLQTCQDESGQGVITSGTVDSKVRAEKLKNYVQKTVDSLDSKVLDVTGCTNLTSILQDVEKDPSVMCKRSESESCRSWTVDKGQTIKVLLGKPEESGAMFVADVSESSRRTSPGDIKFHKKAPFVEAQVSFPTHKVDNRKRLTETFQILMKACRNNLGDDKPVILALNPESKSWPLPVYLDTILIAIATLSLDGTKDEVIFCTRSQTVFDDCCKHFDQATGGVDAISGIKTEVVEGSLDKTQVDILVCTTTESLDLRRGAVSNALTQTAGPQLQQEIDCYYPDGIEVGEVAYAKGFELPCKNVYLMALPQRSKEFEQDAIKFYKKNVDTVVKASLTQATKDGHRSIAFPAIGAGAMQYPIDIVAAQMFASVKQFYNSCSDTSVEHVKFIIYHRDVQAVQIFKDMEVKAIQKQHKAQVTLKPSPCTVTIVGLKENIKKAEDYIMKKIKQTDKQFVSSGGTQPSFLGESSGARPKFSQSQRSSVSSQTPQRIPTTSTRVSTGQRKLPIEKRSFDLLQHFLKDELKRAIYYNDGNLVFFTDSSTKLDHKETAIKQKLDEINQLQTDNFFVTINENVKAECKRHCTDNTYCCISHDGKCIDIYGTSYDAVQKVKHQLKLSTGKDAVTNRRDRQFKETDTTSRERGQTVSGTQKLQKQFSWSQDAQHMKVYDVNKILVKVYVGDILNVPVECIVNAANKPLRHGGGVAQVIARAAGSALDEDCRKYVTNNGPLKTTKVYASVAGHLPYKKVLHAVGPEWEDYKPLTETNIRRCERDLRATIEHSFLEAEDKRLDSIAFPAISSAIFGCPMDLCAVQYAKVIYEYQPHGTLKEIHFVDKNEKIVDQVQEALEGLKKNKPASFYNRNVHVRHVAPGGAGSGSSGFRHVKGPGQNAASDKSHQEGYPYCKAIDRGLSCHFDMLQTLYILTGDIFNVPTTVDMLVCSDDKKGSGTGIIATKLSKNPKYKTEKQKAFEKKSVMHGHIIVCDGKDTKFKHVAHAILFFKKDFLVESERRKKIEEMFLKIFELMKEKKCKSLVMPLLGTGKGSADPEFYTECIFTSLSKFAVKSKHEFEIYFVNKDFEKTNLAMKIAKDKFSKASSTDKNQSKSAAAKQTDRYNPKSASTSKDKKYDKTHGSDTRSGHGSDKGSGHGSDTRSGHGSDTRSGHGSDTRSGHDTTMNQTPGRSPGKMTSPAKGDKTGAAKDQVRGRKPSEGTLTVGSAGTSTSLGSGGSSYFKKQTDETDALNDKNLARKSSGTVELVSESSDHENCVICMDAVRKPRHLKCGHVFCTECIEAHFQYKEACPTCGTVCGVITGDQPKGEMSMKTTSIDCPGHKGFGRIEITYSFPDGRQGSQHPSPGQPYKGITRTAFLPNNRQGQNIYKMLKVAFDRKLVFTIGRSTTTGKDGVITWNDIHHKTDPKPNTQFGYPDPSYLDRVTDELKAKGVTQKDI